MSEKFEQVTIKDFDEERHKTAEREEDDDNFGPRFPGHGGPQMGGDGPSVQCQHQ